MKRLRPDEAAARLVVSRRTIYRWLRDGTLEPVRVRGNTMVDPDRLPPGLLMRPGEAAEILAVSRSTIYRWIDEGVVRGVKIGGCVRVVRADIEAKLSTPPD